MNRYFEETILNADPIDLIRLLYQRAISCVEDARVHLREKRIAPRSAAINRAYAVLAELIASLRPEAAPEISRQLCSLYFYIQQRLLDANLQQAEQPLTEVLSLLATLDEAWAGAAAALSSAGQSNVPAWTSAGDSCPQGERFAVHA
jgi:flagellar protein FliS